MGEYFLNFVNWLVITEMTGVAGQEAEMGLSNYLSICLGSKCTLEWKNLFMTITLILAIILIPIVGLIK